MNYVKRLSQNIFNVLVLSFFVVNLSGCLGGGGLDTAYRSLSMSKETAVSVARTAKSLKAQGLISDMTLLKIKDIYERFQRAQRSVIDSAKLAVQAGDSPNKHEQYRTALRIMNTTLLELTTLAIEVGILDKKGEI